MKHLCSSLRQCAVNLFGQIHWNKPSWLNQTSQFSKQHPLQFYSLTLLILLLLFSGYELAHYLNRPEPKLPTATIHIPEILESSDEPQPIQPLSIQFVASTLNQTTPQSVAPLDKIDKEVTAGVALTPELPGTWQWLSDSNLVFTPTESWPAGQTYKITFDTALFASQIKLEKYQYSFTTAPFSAVIKELKLYQNPLDPTTQEVISTVAFNYPVDDNDLAKQVALLTQQSKDNHLDYNVPQIPVTIKYGKLNREAYIRSQPIKLGTEPQYLVLVLDKKANSFLGQAHLEHSVTSKILLPDAKHLLKITAVKTAIVHDLNNVTQQVLTVTSSIGIAPAQLQKALHVYLLPKDYPATKASPIKENYAWNSAAEVTPAILELAKPVKLQPIASDRPFPTLNSFQYNVSADQYLYIRIDNNLIGNGGYLLDTPYQTLVKAPKFPQEIQFLHKGALLALGSEPKISLSVQNIPAVKFDINRVLASEINHLVSQTGGDYNAPYFLNYSFTQNDLSELFTQVRQFNTQDPARAQYTALDLSQYLTTNALGLFLVTVNSWDMQNNTKTGIKANRLLLITDMGLLVKNNLDQTHDVFIQSIKTGLPVSNAQVQLLGRNGIPVATSITDGQGQAHFDSVSQFIDSQEPTVFVAKKEQDVSFIPYQPRDRAINYSRFDIDGINDEEDSALSAFVFSDRGIYRPGDDLHFGIVVKQAYAKAAPNGIPFEAEFTDPNGNIVFNKKMTLNADGFLTLDHTSHENSLTGNYTLTLYTIKDNNRANQLGYAQVQVAEFLPDTMKIISELSAQNEQGWVSPEKLKAKISLVNLTGLPASDRKVTGKLILTPKALRFDQFPGYSFYDPLFDPKKSRLSITEEIPAEVTNQMGQTEIDFHLERFEKTSYQLTFYAQGFAADSGRSVTSRNSVIVSPLDYLIGYKPDGDMGFINKDSARSIKLLTVNNQLKPMALTNVTLQVLEQNSVATLTEKQDGTFQYETIIQETPLGKTTLDLPANEYTYLLPTNKIGRFILAIIAPNGVTMGRVPFVVVGNNQTNLQKNTELTLKLDKPEYNAGDTINLQITAPYSGHGLITIERDKVHAVQWFTATTTDSLQSIQLPNDFIGNGYVNVTFVRDWNTPEIFLSPLSYSVIPFTTNKSAQTVTIDLAFPQQAKPGEALPIQYSTNQPSKIIVYGIDEGILQVANYTTPDPLVFFFQKRALSVTTSQIIDQILPKYMANLTPSSVGGDGSDETPENYLNPFKRKGEAPIVFWSGIIDAGPNPQTYTYTLPTYFNGSLRVMAVAVAANALGSDEKAAQVRGDFILTPNVPTVIAPGDTFDVSIAVTNNVAQSGEVPVNVTLEVDSGLTLINEKSQELTIPEKQEKVAHFTLRATDHLGNSNLTFVASHNDKQAHIQATTSVRPALVYQTTLISGIMNKQTYTIPLSRELYPEMRKQTAVAANTPAIFLQGLQFYLSSYPYGCTEQVTSKGFGYLAYAALHASAPEFSLSEKLQDTLQILRQRHTSQGGFLYWPGASEESWDSRFASVYTVHFLTQARDSGNILVQDLIPSGLDYLRTLLSQPIKSLDDARLQAYASYVLTRNEIVTTNYLINLQLYLEQNDPNNWRKDIASSLMGASFKLLKDDKTADQLIDGYQLNSINNNNADYSNNPFFNQVSNNALYLYILSSHFPDKFLARGEKSILSLASDVAKNQIDTTNAAFTMLALSAYQPSVANQSAASIQINEIFANNQSKALSVSNDLKPLPIDDNVVSLQFINDKAINYFYQISQAGYDKDLPTKPIKQGLEMLREYTQNSKPITQVVKQGETLTVSLKIRSTDNQNYAHIAIVDLLPGGFEIIPNSFKGKYDYYDAREDRVLFFTSVAPSVTEITYQMKPIAKGKFIIPPTFAENMYNQRIMTRGVAGEIEVE